MGNSNSEYTILKEVTLLSKLPTRKTKHYEGSKELQQPYKLQIVQYEQDTGFYLFYLDYGDELITDTYHMSVEDAMAQAEWEYNVTKDEWVNKQKTQ